eukprot:3941655-Rhodomonas_salina.1
MRCAHGTELAYGATPLLCGVRYCARVWCYAVSGTERAYAARHAHMGWLERGTARYHPTLPPCAMRYALSAVLTWAIVLRARYALSGTAVRVGGTEIAYAATEIAYAATHWLCALPTELGYVATLCAATRKGQELTKAVKVLPSPYALRPTSYALRPTSYALHPTPYALHPTPYALHPTPYILRPTSYALP